MQKSSAHELPQLGRLLGDGGGERRPGRGKRGRPGIIEESVQSKWDGRSRMPKDARRDGCLFPE